MKQRWRDIFSIDLRSLALFRLGLAAFVLFDLVNRVADLTAHYTWSGVVSAGLMKSTQGKLIYLTPHYYCASSVLLQAGLFAFHGLFALALFTGIYTRVATIACWYLVCSLQMCNGSLWYGADDVLRLCLFWGMFLPLGARFSVDSAAGHASRPVRDVYMSAATAAYLIQVALIYLAAAAFKLKSHYWIEGDAVRYALHYDWYVTTLGVWIREQAWLIPWLTWGTIAVEGLGPLMVFAPVWNGPLRMAGAAALMALHVGFIFTMSILLFPYASLVCLLPLIPTWCWRRCFHRLRTESRLGLRIYYDGTCTFCRRMVRLIHTVFLLPETQVEPASPGTDEAELMERVRSWVVVDGDGLAHTRFDGFVTILRHSPWACWMARPLALPPIGAIGDGLYRWVAAHRSHLVFLTEPLEERPLRVRLHPVAGAFVAFALVIVILLTLRTLKVPIPDTPLKTVARVLRLGPQNWSMFGMGNEVSDSWLVMSARLVDGSEIDLLRCGDPVDWSKPTDVRAIYPSYRWMQYFHFKPRWPMYVDYVKKQWNGRHSPQRKIQSLDIYAMVEVTHHDHVAEPRKVLLHSTGVLR